MKHIFVYLNPSKSFNEVSEALFKIQVDNLSLLGINPKDIILATNFPYEYKGIKATIFGDHNIMKNSSTACKAAVLYEMFRDGMIEKDIYWMKDLDTFQVRPVSNEEIGLDEFEVGLTTYGWIIDGKEKWNTGSLFVTNKCGPFADAMFGSVLYYRMDEETGISNYIRDQAKDGKIWNIKIKKLSRAYNVGYRGVEWDIEGVSKPLAALHFPVYQNFFDRMKQYMNPELPGIIAMHLPYIV